VLRVKVDLQVLVVRHRGHAFRALYREAGLGALQLALPLLHGRLPRCVLLLGLELLVSARHFHRFGSL